MAVYRFAHCSDIHQLFLAGLWPFAFFNKRVTGGLNLLLNRRRHYRGEQFGALLDALGPLALDRLVITGDLTNLALASELVYVRQQLASLGLEVTVIPGNHDAYTRGAARSGVFERELAPFMAGEREDGSLYPFVLAEGPVAFVGCSSAIPTAPFSARGELGEAQLARLDRALDRLARDQPERARVVLVHHPVSPAHTGPRRGLVDHAGFARVIERRGAELVLHGHEHRALDYALHGPAGRVVQVHGIPSAIATSADPARRAAFAVYEVTSDAVGTVAIARTRHLWDGARFAPSE